MSIHQLHVYPIVSVKAEARPELMKKINTSLLNEYTRVDYFDRNALSEGQDLQSQVERFRKLDRKYPELIKVDKIYLT